MEVEKIDLLRDKHKKIIYHSYEVFFSENVCEIKYNFELVPGILFNPIVRIPAENTNTTKLLDRFIFLTGIVELLSYWKLACPEIIEIKAGDLSREEIAWFKKLYKKGLGEFFYLNNLDPNISFEFEVNESTFSYSQGESLNQKKLPLVMIGGGKDSLVSLKILNELGYDCAGFFLNPIPSAISGFDLFGFSKKLVLERKISPNLIVLNKQGYLNGHTPFSAILSFYGLITALLNGQTEIVTSNESTANEGNVSYHGVDINHQFSKTFEYEQMFSEILKLNNCPVTYYSLLRGLNELQITGILATDDRLLDIFLSCNRAQTIVAKQEGKFLWCGECPKCIFTFLCLTYFLNIERCQGIIGPSILSSQNLVKTIMELVGLSEHKSFECVGSFEESRAAFLNFFEKLEIKGIRIDKKIFSELEVISEKIKIEGGSSRSKILSYWDSSNFIPENLENILKSKIGLVSCE